jgi:hypothetical protein
MLERRHPLYLARNSCVRRAKNAASRSWPRRCSYPTSPSKTPTPYRSAWVGSQRSPPAAPMRGHKIGLTSRAMQISLADQTSPTTARCWTTCSSRRRRHPCARFIAPRSKWSWPSCWARPLEGTEDHPVRRAQRRHRLRDAGDRDHRRAHRAVRPRTPSARARSSTPFPTTPPTPASCSAGGRCKPHASGPALVSAPAAIKTA